MKKLLLSFMALFLALGTAMAQDDKTEESAGFGISWMSPEDGALTTSVYNIMMSFTEDVIVTIPEGGIDVVNNETKEVVKIIGYYEDEYFPKNQVQFVFEQKLLPGKDGKEELQSLIIETPGSYSYTIPAGCIKSTSGEAFPETTFTFSIVATFPITNYSPTQTTENIEEIVLTFEKEVTAVNLPKEYPLTVYNSSWKSAATVDEATISEDKKGVTLVLSEPLTIGQYMLSINQGVIVTDDGINAESYLYFNVIDPNPTFVTNYQDGEEVKELSNVFEITFKNVETVELKQETMTLYLPSGGDIEGTATLADNKITVTFDQTFTNNDDEKAEYIFYIPAGMFTMDGVENELREVKVYLLPPVKITPLAIDSVVPVLNEEGALAAIRVAFNQQVYLAYDEDGQSISSNINLMDANGNTINLVEVYNWELPYSTFEYILGSYDEANGYKLITTPITEAGTYTLDLSQIVVQYGHNPEDYTYAATGSCEGTYTYTHVSTAINTAKAAEGEQAIYDLLGRRVEKITGAGIYIVNGKKVVIK